MNACGNCPYCDDCIAFSDMRDQECKARENERRIMDILYEKLEEAQSQEEWNALNDVFLEMEKS